MKNQLELNETGTQGITEEDLSYKGSRFADVKKAVFANPYQKIWGAPNGPALPVHEVSLKRACSGMLPGGKPDQLREASVRTLETAADLRWGESEKGFRKIVHANGVCLNGVWEITEDSDYSGYFKKGSKGLFISRISCGTEAVSCGHYRSFGLAGKLYPTLDENHEELLKPANFVLVEKITGSKAKHVTDIELTNTLDIKITESEDLSSALILARAALVFGKVNVDAEKRQLYPIAELDKEQGEETNAPEFMCLKASEGSMVVDEADVRDETLGHIFDKGNPKPQRKLIFDILVSNQGERKGNLLTGVEVIIDKWHKIGAVTFEDAVASYNGDFVLHFSHAPWRENRSDADTEVEIKR